MREKEGRRGVGEREREREREREERERVCVGGGVGFLTAGCTSARQSSNSKISSALHLSCCVIR